MGTHLSYIVKETIEETKRRCTVSLPFDFIPPLDMNVVKRSLFRVFLLVL